MVIHTGPSGHADVPEAAFLVQVDGLTLFFAGDDQGKLTRGGPCLAAELQELEALPTRAADAGFSMTNRSS